MDTLFDTVSLIAALAAMDRPQAFLRDRYYGNVVTSTDEEIAVDKLLKRKKMAPFVSPDVAAKERAMRGRSVETFRPAYIKPLNTIRPTDLVKRAHGEGLTGDLSPEERRLAIINQTLLDQDDEITRREEWMCAQIMRSGIVTVEGEDYETQIVDFKRPANQTVALAGVSRWGETGVSILSDLRSWASTTQRASGGVVTDVILGAGAAELVQKDPELKEIMDNRRQASGAFELGPVASGSQEQPATYLGSVGQFNFITYSQIFEDDEGNDVEIWPDYGVGLVAPNVHAGNMAYGAILNLKSLEAVSRFPHHFETENPSREHLTTEAAPLPVPSEIAATFFATAR